MTITVVEFITLDGIVSDPDGSGGSPQGGWMFRYGTEGVVNDPFRLGATLDDGVLLLGRSTWQAFSKLWPTRTDSFSDRMNAVPKLVATRHLSDVSAWSHSAVIDGDLAEAVREEKRDVVVMGSLRVVATLAAEDLIDEYRLISFPTVIGEGERLFPEGARTDLECILAEQVGAVVRTRYRRVR
jgi:dihydrofolate reductase